MATLFYVQVWQNFPHAGYIDLRENLFQSSDILNWIQLPRKWLEWTYCMITWAMLPAHWLNVGKLYFFLLGSLHTTCTSWTSVLFISVNIATSHSSNWYLTFTRLSIHIFGINFLCILHMIKLSLYPRSHRIRPEARHKSIESKAVATTKWQ